MESLDILEEVLTKSLEKNGDKLLTIKHLLNIVKMVNKQIEKEIDEDLIPLDIDNNW